MKKLAIIGSGDLGQQIAYHAINDKQFKVVGFFDDFAEVNSEQNGFKVLGKLDTIESFFEQNFFDEIIIGIGYKHLALRASLYARFKNKIKLAIFIHSSCYVDNSCKIGEGVCMFPGSIIDQNVVIKGNVLININCTIAHDTMIEKNTFLSPSVALAGFVTIGKRCNIGINATIIDNLKIVDDVQIGAGTVVINDIDKPGVYVGNPARFIR